MVRLEEIEAIAWLGRRHGFQFQYGAIRSLNVTTLSLYVLLFQFQYGAIRRKKNQNFRQQEFQYFNSSMVRLEEVNKEVEKSDSAKFQFQYGAIRRDVYNIQFHLLLHISIPVWCD